MQLDFGNLTLALELRLYGHLFQFRQFTKDPLSSLCAEGGSKQQTKKFSDFVLISPQDKRLLL